MEKAESGNAFLNFFDGKSLSLPLGELAAFLVVISVLLALGKHRIGFLVSYLAVFYWVFVSSRSYFMGFLGETAAGLYVYGFIGLFMFVIAIVGFIQKG